MQTDSRTAMPSPEAQADLIRSTYAAAGLSLEKTAYFEAHGMSCDLKTRPNGLLTIYQAPVLPLVILTSLPV